MSIFNVKYDFYNNLKIFRFSLTIDDLAIGVVANTRFLRKRSGVRISHSVNFCVHEHVCLYWVWVFLCYMYVFTKKNYISMYLSLARIHNTSLISASFGLDV
jgi:hypothetical protein